MNLPDYVLDWCSKLGSSESSLKKLQGGINNLVYRCGEQKKWIIKGYSRPGMKDTDRMQAEVEFLQYAYLVAPGLTPKLFHVDTDRRCIIIEYIDGKTYPSGQPPSQASINAAVDFFRKLNGEPEKAKLVINQNACEGFASISEHLTNIERRLNDMQYQQLTGNARIEAKRLIDCVKKLFEKEYEEARMNILAGSVTDEICQDCFCISPSDFGFHNAIKTTSGIKFIDFEFAGWDDPAKAVLDFMLQPHVPIQSDLLVLLQGLPYAQHHDIVMRCKVLMPILNLKWICIILSVLNPAKLEKMKHTLQIEKYNDLIDQRLNLALQYKERMESTYIPCLENSSRFIY